MTSVLLLSGGIDSTCVAAWQRPDACLYVDYGQRPARAEAEASAWVAHSLGIPWHRLSADCSEAGSGLMATGSALETAPTPEWWPFRNQLLLTLGAAWAVQAGLDEVVVGAVAGDRSRHRDGTPWFYARIDALVAGQEGSLRVRAPALNLSTEELIARVDAARGMLGVTHSCHVADLACGECPGCIKRAEVMVSLESSSA